MLGVGAADVGGARLGKAEEQHLSLPDEIADGPGDLFDRHGRIDPVLVEEIDPVGSKAPQRAFDRLADRFRPAVPLCPGLHAAYEAEAEFGRDGHMVASPLERAPDQLFVGERTVALGRVEKRTSELDGVMERRDRFCLVRRAVGLAHPHAAEADRRNLETLAAEFALAQGHAYVPARGERRGSTRERLNSK